MRLLLLSLTGLLLGAVGPRAQPAPVDSALFSSLEYRLVGPFRGGRASGVAGIAGDPLTYYQAATGGGVWRTTDAGGTWENISDGSFGGSIGSVAVAPSDPNVIYVGGGEKSLRGNVSPGWGMWKSEDAGRSWRSLGFEGGQHIPRMVVHPRDEDVVYAAVLGHAFGPNADRGVFRSTDGGDTWEHVLFVNEDAGAFELEMDPTNPRILYASIWRVRRTPYSFSSGGEGSSIWKSTDGGDTWTDISNREGLPDGIWGISAVSISPADPDRVYALVENEDGGLFRSDDAGETWTRVSTDRNLRQRAWYFTRLGADPQDPDKVWVLNVQLWVSTDGGKTFESVDTPHADHHDIWIAPEDGDRIVIADDGGAQVTFDGGRTWSTYMNQPTAQFYRVTTDTHFPYRIYGGQQDNSTIRIAHRSAGGTITERDWEPSAGGESGWLAPHPEDPDIVFGGSYGGFLQMVNHRTGESRIVNVWPENPIGAPAKDLKIRFQWNFPLLFSQYRDEATGDYPLYAAGNHLYRSLNLGQSWERISPDLTRADPETLGSSGGPITQDNTSVEYYGTIFALAESPHEPGVLWVGSDDGLLHVTRDGGGAWTDATPPVRLLPEGSMINSVEPDPRRPGGLYVAATRYKVDDFRPFLLHTDDYGQSWRRIDEGIPDGAFTRVIRADPARPGLLYTGTEQGMYVSFSDGAGWQPFQLNLPVVPITDLAVRQGELVVATQGRSFWVLDDLTPLYQINSAVAEADVWLFQPKSTYRVDGYRSTDTRAAGTNPEPGVTIHYRLAEAPDSTETVALRILDRDGETVQTFTSDAEDDGLQMPTKVGMNRVVWGRRYPDAARFDGMIFWGGGLSGPEAVPGTYTARLIVGEDSLERPFEIRLDPRSSATPADLEAQFVFLREVRDKVTEVNESVGRVRDLRNQVNAYLERLPVQATGADTVRAAGESLVERMTAVEEALYETRSQSRQDPLNYGINLGNELSALGGTVAAGDFRPTDQAYAYRDEVMAEIEAELVTLRQILDRDVPAFNALVREQALPVIVPTDAD
ncbi:glycosyl hydrolase [Rubrivirga sp. S365]|uniref:Glycosyl hydrolase n=1 Tax=Rubrivirga litoralis TaxID=3075598 RepID=A0ABU3BLK6_9BACT|nr:MULTISPECIES: glycosyl hydrolase [unclassified Rubrivirga]MDT0630173.1 glycosyl hydrolase [Rubrivirga sp. F394]MDT7855684.1 glycosyl hydrolase [Rubrivirga sp. S365]